MLTLGLTFIKFSAHTELKGVTVFDPIILNEPERAGVVGVGVVVTGVEVGVDAVLQPVKTKARTSISARGKSHFFTDLNNFFLLILSFFF
jgi:hypothetical protein